MKYTKFFKIIYGIVLISILSVIVYAFVYINPKTDTEDIKTDTYTKAYTSDDGVKYTAIYDINNNNKLVRIDDLCKFPIPTFTPVPSITPTPPPEPEVRENAEDLIPTSTPTPTPIPTQRPVKSERLIASDFTLTHYCNCAKCCGKAGQPTASGRMPQTGVTVGVDRKLIKLGTYLRIDIPDGKGGYKVYRSKARADDTGGAIKGHKIDVFVGGHQEALNLGVIRNARVYLIGE